MKTLIIFLMSLLPVAIYADTLNCYSGGKLIYSGEGKNVGYEAGVFSINEPKKDVLVYGDCVATAPARN